MRSNANSGKPATKMGCDVIWKVPHSICQTVFTTEPYVLIHNLEDFSFSLNLNSTNYTKLPNSQKGKGNSPLVEDLL